MNTLTTKNLTKSYGSTTVLSDVSLNLLKGSFTVIVGPSGCGKSTLLKMIAGIESPDSGTVLLEGTPSMVFQNGSLLPWRDVYDNVALGLESKKISAREQKHQITELITTMGLSGHENSYPRDLSGGQRQRVGIARALVSNPQILLLDEPFSALDAETTANLHSELLKLWKEKELTILMISHSLDEAIELADTVYVMNKGKVVHCEQIEFPRPRLMENPNIATIRGSIRNLLKN